MARRVHRSLWPRRPPDRRDGDRHVGRSNPAGGTSEFSSCVTVSAGPDRSDRWAARAARLSRSPARPSTVALALRGRAGDDIDRTELWCRAFPPQEGAVFAGGVGGDTGADYDNTLTCPANSTMTGSMDWPASYSLGETSSTRSACGALTGPETSSRRRRSASPRRAPRRSRSTVRREKTSWGFSGDRAACWTGIEFPVSSAVQNRRWHPGFSRTSRVLKTLLASRHKQASIGEAGPRGGDGHRPPGPARRLFP